MILYVNGDSHSAGAELTNSVESWPNILTKRLGLTLVNESKSGGSNPRILRTAGNYTTHSKDIFVIIGWTSWEREEWQVDKVYYDVNSGGHDNLPLDLKEKYKTWVIDQDQVERERKSKITHEQIHKLHRHYKECRIPHLFFNAVMPFLHNGDKLSWGKNYLGPYDNDLSYYWYLKKAGYVPTSDYHHLEDAQKIWADVLYNYIKENSLL